MVSSTIHENGDTTTEVSKGLPPGNYCLVGWDMDATGKRLIDEICQIAVYTPKAEYAQYVMPFKNLTPPAMKRHHLKIVTMGRYRVLKNSTNNKVLKTKSEISALGDFLDWLEAVRVDAPDGVILVHHEPRRVNPSMLIEALTKYKLLDRFKRTVKGFVNGFDIAEAKCADSFKSFSLRTLSRVLLGEEKELSSAAERALLALRIIEHLSEGESKKSEEEVGSGDNEQKIKSTFEFIREFVQPVEAEEKEHAEHKLVWLRQISLNPIFEPLRNSMARRDRQHATPLRRLLAESVIDYAQLQDAWNNEKREGLEDLVKTKVKAEKKDIDDLIEVLDCHFDPEKKPAQPSEEDKKNMKKIKSEMKKISINNNLSGTESPDATSLSPIKAKTEEEVVPTNIEVQTESD